ncbi:hypothetical protein KDW46_27610 [Burkholderia vietnamiensis]|nr:hypothetical protein [Burkholderia vietnamiensis]
MAGDFLQLSRHKTIYLFRRRVPRALVARLGRVELYKSLGTADRKIAAVRARALATYTDQVFARMKAMGPSDDDLIKVELFFKFDFDEDNKPRSLEIGDVGPDDGPVVAQVVQSLFPDGSARQQIPPRAAPAALPALSLADAVDLYLKAPGIKPTTLKRYRTVLEHFCDALGANTPLASIDQSRFAEYAATVQDNADWATKTKINYITIPGTFLGWHRSRNGALPIVTAAKLKPKREQPAWQDRDAFTLDEIGALFKHVNQYRTSEPHKYWVTIAVAMLGCRVEELAQIDLRTDIRSQHGIWYLDLNERPDQDGAKRKSMKRLSSWRMLPLPSGLVDAGFVAYLQQQHAKGFSRPFESAWKPHIDQETDGVKWSHPISKWGGRELKLLKNQGIVENTKTTYFHSMRHTFTTTLASAGISEEIRAALIGQEFGGVNSQIYNKIKQDVSESMKVMNAISEKYSALLR